MCVFKDKLYAITNISYYMLKKEYEFTTKDYDPK